MTVIKITSAEVAERAGVSQSAVSRQVHALELQIGVTLFHRHARGLLLTEQGDRLYKTTQEIVSVTVGADRKSVLLKVKNLQAGHTHHLQSSGVRSKSGGELWHKDAYYTINEFPAR